MQSLQPQEVEILNEFQSRLLNCKKNKELMVLSPKAYIDKRIDEIIASKSIKTEDFTFSPSKEEGSPINLEDPIDYSSNKSINKPPRNRLIVPSIKTFESNRKLLLEEQNKDQNKENSNKINKMHEKNERTSSKHSKHLKESGKKSCEKNPCVKKQNDATLNNNVNNIEKTVVNLTKKGEVKKICNKKLAVRRMNKILKENLNMVTPEFKSLLEEHILKCECFACEILTRFK